MNRTRLLVVALAATAFVLGFWIGDAREVAAAGDRVFELRTYTTNPGKLDALKARFRDHTATLFEKHGIDNIGYWTPTDAPGSSNMFVYIVAHKSRSAAKQSWQAFRKDPAWLKAKAASEVNGGLVSKIDNVFMTPTDFSPAK